MLPLPPHYQASQVGKIWRVPYQQRATEAATWATQYNIPSSHQDPLQVGLLLIDVQNTFCIPEFELFVGGRSGLGAVEDNQRLCEFIYRNLDKISQIILTLDTHTALQIFHPIFWVNPQGQHPTPASSLIYYEEVQQGVWQVNPAIANTLGQDYQALQAHALHYTKQLSDRGKYPLTVWPYHSMLGGIGHAIVPAIEEAVFFHTIARHAQAQFELKGNHPLTENYSVLQPEVLDTVGSQQIAQKNQGLIQKLLNFDRLIIAGQAKSHCVAWTVEDLLTEIQAIKPQFTQRVDLLEDCTSPVVVPDVVDYTEQANTTFERFAAAGMNVIQSVEWVERLTNNK